MKTKHDVILPGHGIYWIIGSIVGVLGLLALTGVILVNTPNNPGAYVEQTAVTPDRMQDSVKAMADFMVKDGNTTGLRMWARSLRISSPEFSSARTLREEIRRASNDFALYRDKEKLMHLIELLGDNAAVLDEVVR